MSGYVDEEEAARRLGLPLRTIRQLIRDGKLRAAHGWPPRIPVDELSLVLERCRIKPGEVRANQYAGRPETGVAEWMRSRRRAGRPDGANGP